MSNKDIQYDRWAETHRKQLAREREFAERFDIDLTDLDVAEDFYQGLDMISIRRFDSSYAWERYVTAIDEDNEPPPQ